jgi:hypothetical protein
LAVSSIIRSVISSPIRGALGAAGSLIEQATDELGGQISLHYWDFTTNRALFNGADVGAVTATPNWSFTRATVGTAEDLAGNIVQFSSGQLRRTDRGLLIEGARTNLFLNSATGGTQSVTVAAVAHTQHVAIGFQARAKLFAQVATRTREEQARKSNGGGRRFEHVVFEVQDLKRPARAVALSRSTFWSAPTATKRQPCST